MTDIYQQFDNIAERVDNLERYSPPSQAGGGVPPAGTTGQVLSKASDDDYDTEWQTVGGTGTVTSVAVSGSDGIEVDSGSPITGAGTIALGVNASSMRSHINVENGADVTDAQNVGSSIHGASAKTTPPVDADTVALIDSEASNVLKKLSWSNIKVTLKDYFDTIYSTFDGAYSSLSGIPSTFAPSSHNNTAHSETYITASGVTFENLDTNSDVGTGATQVAQGNHTHTPASLGAAAAVGFITITVDDSEPSSPATGDIWIDTS